MGILYNFLLTKSLLGPSNDSGTYCLRVSDFVKSEEFKERHLFYRPKAIIFFIMIFNYFHFLLIIFINLKFKIKNSFPQL